MNDNYKLTTLTLTSTDNRNRRVRNPRCDSKLQRRMIHTRYESTIWAQIEILIQDLDISIDILDSQTKKLRAVVA